MRKLICFLILTVNGVACAMTNLVIKDKGEFSSALTFQEYSTDDFWNENGKRRHAYDHLHLHEYISYSEYGVTFRDTVGAQFGFDCIKDQLNGNTYGMTDIELTWKHLAYSLCQHHFATQLTAVIPVQTEFTPALRYGRFGGEAALFYYSDFMVRDYVSWYDFKAGYRHFNGFPSDQIRSHFRIGCCLGEYFQLFAATFLDYGLFNGRSQLCANPFLLESNYRLWTAEIQGTFSLNNHFYLSIGYSQHLWGENVGAGGGPFASAAIAF